MRELIKRFKEIQSKRIVLEATGGLERELLSNIAANGFEVVSINPGQARYIAQ